MSDVVALPLPPRTRRWRFAAFAIWSALVGLELVALGVGHVGDNVVGASRNVIFPGLGFIEWNRWIALLAAAIAAVALIAWFAWGADWLVAFVWATAALVAWRVVPPSHHHSSANGALGVHAVRASHEFGAVMALVAALRWVRGWTIGRPTMGKLLGRGRDAPPARYSVVDRSRAAAVVALARHAGVEVAVEAPNDRTLTADIARRARRVGRVARMRWRGDPLRGDHAAGRAALAATGRLDGAQLAAFAADAERSWCGVPASEPTWVRPLDALLAAAALFDAGVPGAARRWQAVAADRLALRHGRRPAWVHTPSAISGGAAPWWEHATFAALSGAFGWLDIADDWSTLRARCLGTSARRPRSPHEARLVAAGRVLATTANDIEAMAILSRPSLRDDPLANALAAIATAVAERPGRLRRPIDVDIDVDVDVDVDADIDVCAARVVPGNVATSPTPALAIRGGHQ